ncbi:MAG: L-threonylcarbamoyladenylate synthase [Synergistaceae bacterium]|nr:L-threonylcarbamoyladenylate synthase [Synergistaceae bacterium]
MKYLSVDRWNPEKDIILEAAGVLKAGGLVAFPTETVYGLGANGLDGRAVKKIFEAKGRPVDNPLILHISDPAEADDFAYVNTCARGLMDRFFPGALTLVLPAKPVVPRSVTANLDTVAFRMPSHPVPLALIESLGSPIAAPSANRSGRPSPTDAAAVIQDAGAEEFIDIVLDGGICDIGIESTVIDVSGENVFLLRPGGAPTELIEEFLGVKLTIPTSAMLKSSPGTRYKHYAPFIPLLLWENDNGTNEKQSFSCSGSYGYIGLNQPDFYCNSPCKEKIIFKCVENYARGVYASFRSMEKIGVSCIIAEVPNQFGIGQALKDRLFRAAGCL